MSSDPKLNATHQPYRSLRWRLIAAYSLAFTLCLATLFAILDVHMRRAALRQVDVFLAAEGRRMLDLSARRKPRILEKEFERFAGHHGVDRVFLQLFETNGVLLAASPMSSQAALALEAVSRSSGNLPSDYFVTWPYGTSRIRVYRDADVSGRTITVARSLAEEEAPVVRSRRIVLIGLAASLVIGSVLTYLVTARALRRVAAMRAAAQTIAEGDIAHRVSVPPEHDELHDLAVTFNAMLERIEHLMHELRSVTDDIAHELRTPLTRIRGTMEPLLTHASSPEETRDAAALVVEECDRLTRTIAIMLQIARLESTPDTTPRVQLELCSLIREVADAFAPLIEDKQLSLTLELPDAAAEMNGDSTALQRVFGNLLDNAIKYTPAGGRVGIRLSTTPQHIQVDVHDSGIGMAPEDLPHIFERFYRAPGGQHEPGTGLGLCLVRAIVVAHAGTIRAESAPGRGTRFILVFSRAATAALT